MASSDIRLSVGLPHHPKTRKLIRRLGDGAAWNLVCLFIFAGQNKTDGNLAGMTDEDIEISAGWSGDMGAFCKCLREVGFLDGEPVRSSIHQWAEHNPWAATSANRSESARKAAYAKHAGGRQSAPKNPAGRMRVASEAHAESCEAHADIQNPQCPISISNTISNTNTKSITKTKRAEARFDPSQVDLPEWLPRESWAMWCKHRRELRKPVTESTCAAQLRQLEKWHQQGHDPGPIIAASVANGWQGLFEPKTVATKHDDQLMSVMRQAGVL